MKLINDPTGQNSPQFDLGDVVRQFLERIPPNEWNRLSYQQKKALRDIATCMTSIRGGRRYFCKDCEETFDTYYGCKNRSCPKCHGQQTVNWILKMEAECLPYPYYHIIISIPTSLHTVFYQGIQKEYLYGLFMSTVRKTLLELANDPKYLGAIPIFHQIFHTWNGRMEYHPHVHIMMSAGGMRGEQWVNSVSRTDDFFPAEILSQKIKENFRKELESKDYYYSQIKESAWKADWKTYSKRYGKGEVSKLIKYLGKFAFRVAITRNQLLEMDENTVTFRYKDRKTEEWKQETLDGVAFLKRFVQHVLPESFNKMRSAGLIYHKRLYELAMEKLKTLPFLSLDLNDSFILEVEEDKAPPAFLNRFQKICPRCDGLDLECIVEVKWGPLPQYNADLQQTNEPFQPHPSYPQQYQQQLNQAANQSFSTGNCYSNTMPYGGNNRYGP